MLQVISDIFAPDAFMHALFVLIWNNSGWDWPAANNQIALIGPDDNVAAADDEGRRAAEKIDWSGVERSRCRPPRRARARLLLRPEPVGEYAALGARTRVGRPHARDTRRSAGIPPLGTAAAPATEASEVTYTIEPAPIFSLSPCLLFLVRHRRRHRQQHLPSENDTPAAPDRPIDL